ncbi:MAG: hypothetical protein DLM55_05845 [Acidimicrobiales bacterium]|nr:MAG: hypothetical protein DLM55_05845 [Acidimicrobiales bacterium]
MRSFWKHLSGLLGRVPKKSTSLVVGLVLVAVVIATMGATLFGVDAAQRALRLTDGEVWVWSPQESQAQRVNVGSGQVDIHRAFTDAKNHQVILVQTDQHLLLHDLTDGKVTTVNLKTLDSTAQLKVSSGPKTNVAMWHDKVLLLDSVKGEIRRLDPTGLDSRGESLPVGSDLRPAGFDGQGTYWLVAHGAAVGVRADGDRGTPHIVKKTHIAAANHEFAVTALDSGMAVVDATSHTVTFVDRQDRHAVDVPGLDQPRVAARTYGGVIAISQPASRHVVLVEGGSVRSIAVPGEGKLGEAIVFSGRIYVTDIAAGQIIVLDLAGKPIQQLPVSGSAEPITFSQDEGRLIIDSAEAGTALFVDRGNHVTTVQKDPGQHGQETSSSAKPPVGRPQGGNRRPGKLPAPQTPFKLPSFIPFDLSNLPANSSNSSNNFNSGGTQSSSSTSQNGRPGTSRNGLGYTA